MQIVTINYEMVALIAIAGQPDYAKRSISSKNNQFNILLYMVQEFLKQENFDIISMSSSVTSKNSFGTAFVSPGFRTPIIYPVSKFHHLTIFG